MKISIFTTTWMLAKLTRVCLYTIAQQDFPHDKMEIILIDDGSKDENSAMKVYDWMQMGTVVNWYAENSGYTVKGVFEEVKEKFPDIEMRYYYLDNPGWTNPAWAWNVGIKQCRGDIILQIHSDMFFGDRHLLTALYEPHLEKDNYYLSAYKAGVRNRGEFLDFIGTEINMDRVEEYMSTKSKVYLGSQKGYGFLPWCYSVRREWLYKIRGYDEGYLSRKGGMIDVMLMSRLERAA